MAPRRVAISQRVVEVPGYDEVRDCLDQQWTVWLESLDLVAVPVPNRTADVAGYCADIGVSAIFLTGGNNFSEPAYEDESVQVSDGSAIRDATEFALIRHAIELRLPLIAWCRGMQTLQVYFGGKLARTEPSPIGHVATTHDVRLVSPEFTPQEGEIIRVNSYHDFGIRRSALALPLREFAVADDDFVEAVYHSDLPIVGCQWHPERAGGADGFNRWLVRRLLRQAVRQ